MAESRLLESHAREDAQRFPAVCSTPEPGLCLAELRTQVGAERRNCTYRLRITSAAQRYLCLQGELVETPAGRSCLGWYRESPRLVPWVGFEPTSRPLPGAGSAG